MLSIYKQMRHSLYMKHQKSLVHDPREIIEASECYLFISNSMVVIFNWYIIYGEEYFRNKYVQALCAKWSL